MGKLKKVIERVPREGNEYANDEVVHYVGDADVAEAVHKALNDKYCIDGYYERMQRFDVKDA